MRPVSRLFDRLSQCAQRLVGHVQQARAARLRKLSTRVPQVALQANQELYRLPRIGRVHSDEKLVDHIDQNFAALSENQRLLCGARQTSGEN